MATETWPSTLPQKFSVQGFRYRPKDNKIVSQPETGPTRERRRSTLRITLINGSIIVSIPQLAIFKQFYHTTLSEVDRFNWADPFDENRVVEMKFINPQYQVSPAGGIDFRIVMALEMY